MTEQFIALVNETIKDLDAYNNKIKKSSISDREKLIIEGDDLLTNIKTGMLFENPGDVTLYDSECDEYMPDEKAVLLAKLHEAANNYKILKGDIAP